MTDNNFSLSTTPSNWPNNPNRPVEMVSWEDAQVFLTRLNEQQAGNLPAGWAYALPTESQWEYACRAGTTTAYSWGNDINSSQANYNWDGGPLDGNDFKQTIDVGQYAANPWGFFDMHGNVWEWVLSIGSEQDRRGGSWYQPGTVLRSANRRPDNPANRLQDLGFRVSLQNSQ
jgi:formylglycine-generating enzyme required for sulfatase activity